MTTIRVCPTPPYPFPTAEEEQPQVVVVVVVVDTLWCCLLKLVEVLLYVHRNRRFIRDGSP